MGRAPIDFFNNDDTKITEQKRKLATSNTITPRLEFLQCIHPEDCPEDPPLQIPMTIAPTAMTPSPVLPLLKHNVVSVPKVLYVQNANQISFVKVEPVPNVLLQKYLQTQVLLSVF